MNYDKVPLTNEEVLIFADRIKRAQEGSLLTYKEYDKCIASALCRVGSNRRRPMCGNYVGRVRDLLTKDIRYSFSDEEMSIVVLYCLDDTLLKDVDTAISCFGNDLFHRLSCMVPILMSRTREVKDFLRD